MTAMRILPVLLSAVVLTGAAVVGVGVGGMVTALLRTTSTFVTTAVLALTVGLAVWLGAHRLARHPSVAGPVVDRRTPLASPVMGGLAVLVLVVLALGATDQLLVGVGWAVGTTLVGGHAVWWADRRTR